MSKTILLVSFCFSGALILLYILLFKVPSSDQGFVSAGSEMDQKGIQKLVKLFGSDLMTLVPNGMTKRQVNNDYIESIIRRSGNPWHVTPHEFFVIRITLAFVGALAGLAFGLLVGNATEKTALMVPLGIVLLALMGWMHPKSHYIKLTNEREMEFKKRLPEAIDLLVMALSGGGYTLANGIEEIIRYLEPSPVKEEFMRISQDVQSGVTMETALNGFAERVPTESIRAFVRALNNANKLSVSLVQILQARSEASRKELKVEAEKRIAFLPTKIMLVLSPASAIAVGTIAIAPSIFQIITAL